MAWRVRSRPVPFFPFGFGFGLLIVFIAPAGISPSYGMKYIHPFLVSMCIILCNLGTEFVGSAAVSRLGNGASHCSTVELELLVLWEVLSQPSWSVSLGLGTRTFPK